jgi:VanZ family protein
MFNRNSGDIPGKVIEVACVSILCAIGIAGLWPFHSPKNEVEWLKNQNGVYFGRHGSIVSSAPLVSNGKEDEQCSLEIWLAPGQIKGMHTILAFDGSGNPRASLWLKQYLDGIVLQRQVITPESGAKKRAFGIKGVFYLGQSVFVTVASKSQSTSIYVNGVLADVSPTFQLSRKDLTGQLVLAGSTNSGGWLGELRGLAVYQEALTPIQIVQHFETWVNNQRPTLAGDEAPVALYLFDERHGNIIHNQVDYKADLVIPTHYFVLHSHFLRYPWDEYLPGWNYVKDTAINITGFIPLGFFLGAYFSVVRGSNRPLATAVALGFSVSLTIETLQAFLPTRSSGMTDIINNTLGTAVGGIFYRCSWGQALLRKVVTIASLVIPTSLKPVVAGVGIDAQEVWPKAV